MMSLVSHADVRNRSSAKPAFSLALDIGTSSIRGAIYDADGNELDGTTVKHEWKIVTSSDGGAEIDAIEAIDQVARTIDEVLAGLCAPASQINIVAVSCFWHSLVGVDKNGKATTPVFGWADTRAARMVTDLQNAFDEQATHARTGCRFHPSYWPAKLLWLRQKRASAYRATVQWLSLSEIIMRRFFGKNAISVSMASGTGLFDQRSCAWDKDLLTFLGVSIERLPALAVDGEFFSGILPDYAKRWPQLIEVKWYPAIGDGAANNIGAGCVTHERASLMIGTSGAMRVMWRGDVPEEIPAELWCYRADRKRVILGGALSDGGGLFAWLKNSLKLDGSDEDIERALDEMQPDEHGLTLLPFWSGERSTGWHGLARGTIAGITQDTRPIEILRAAMEAISYRFALIAGSLDQVTSRSSIVASGGALVSSGVWTQMISDVLGYPVTLSSTREASSRGAVLLALEMEGRIRDIADAPVPLGRTFEPDMTRHARYREGLERQEKLYTRLMN